MGDLRSWLLAQGYKDWGTHAIKSGARLFQKRFPDREADIGDGDDHCTVNVWQYEPVSHRPQWSYQVETYYEVEAGYAVEVNCFTFSGETLRGHLVDVETFCVDLWAAHSKGRKQ